LANGSSTVVQHLTHIPKIEGLSPAERKKRPEKVLIPYFCFSAVASSALAGCEGKTGKMDK